MTDRMIDIAARATTRPDAEIRDLLAGAATGLFPGPALEALIARLEAAK